ncbi:hypothetical protein [Actinoplanes sp. URMC 104]|uniref:hypothetical protein n=1 Tax=Actinoplanes sp. URMC 104 TaxID=3423409 RepID=UPI003F1C6EAC
MVMGGLRRVLLRSLPVLLLLVLAVAPHRPASPPQRATVSCAAEPVVSEPASAGPVAEPPASTVERPADRAAVLASQFTAGARGCRAPPAASA